MKKQAIAASTNNNNNNLSTLRLTPTHKQKIKIIQNHTNMICNINIIIYPWLLSRDKPHLT